MRQWIGTEEAGNAVGQGRPIGELFIEAGKRGAQIPDRILLHPFPELLQAQQPLVRRVARNEPRIDGADRGADDPVRLDAGLVQRLVHPGLIGSECTAALKHQHHLAGQILRHAGIALHIVHILLPESPYPCHVRS
ncbi:hypothetical protein ACVWZ6_003849 [Bradyrhizobium sp. GM6.1]